MNLLKYWEERQIYITEKKLITTKTTATNVEDLNERDVSKCVEFKENDATLEEFTTIKMKYLTKN